MSGSLASLMMGQDQPPVQGGRIPLASMAASPFAGTQTGLMAMLGGGAPPPVPLMAPDDPNRLTTADAYTSTKNTVGDWIAAQRAQAEAQGLWNPQTGLPTQAGLLNAAQQYAGSLIAGTSAPGTGATMDNPAFAKWFGASKAVDESGTPQVLYHGTADSFDEFKPNQPNAKDAGWLGKGFYFWNKPGLASDYSALKPGDSPNVMPVYLKLENPYMATLADKKQLMSDAMKDPFASSDFTESLIRKGHDGVILQYPDRPDLHEVMVFRPEQIKSAIGNSGAFDPKDPRITAGIAGLTAAGAAAASGSKSQ